MNKNIVFILSGSVAVFKACSVISKLVQKGHNLKVIGTKNSLNFIGKSTIEAITGKPFLVDMFENNLSDPQHIELSQWADVAILCPATANIINKMACGIADDLPTTFFLSWEISKKPFLVFPAMNEKMYLHPITQSSIRKLSEIGVKIYEAEEGYLACKMKGKGRLMEPEKIIDIIASL
ncbi:MAG: flavoprotein [Elusimicrobiales bacterium]